MKEELKQYLQQNNIYNLDLLVEHIEELKRNTKPKEVLFELVDLVCNNQSVLNSFFREQKIHPKVKTDILEKIKDLKNFQYLGTIDMSKGNVGEQIKECFKNYKVVDKEQELKSETHVGKKETENKVDYREIDWSFIELLARRMNKNKEKYEPFNYHKPMDVELLKQSLLRHTIEVMKGNYEDAEQEYGHLAAIALNAQMIYYQLLNKSQIVAQ